MTKISWTVAPLLVALGAACAVDAPDSVSPVGDVASRRDALEGVLDLADFAAVTTPAMAIQKKWESYQGLKCPGGSEMGPGGFPIPTPGFEGIGDPQGAVQHDTASGVSYRDFQGGTIVYSPDYGTVLVSTQWFREWMGMAYVQTVISTITVQEALGVPTSDVPLSGPFVDAETDEGAEATCAQIIDSQRQAKWAMPNFAHGTFVTDHRSDGTPTTYLQPMYGAVYDAMQRSEAEGFDLGYFERRAHLYGGRYHVFEHGAVYAKDETKSVIMTRTKHQRFEKGGSIDDYGWPLAAPTDIVDANGNPTGAQQQLVDKGTLFYAVNSDAAPILLHGPVLKAYEADHGGPAGGLGFPISSVISKPDGRQLVDFEKGMIVAVPDGAGGFTVTPVRELQVFVERATGEGDCSLFCSLAVFGDVRVTVDGVRVFDKRYPDEGDSGNADLPIDAVVPVGYARSDLEVTVEVQLNDGDNVTGDDLLGIPAHTFTLDNLWEIAQDGAYEYTATHGESEARAVIVMQEVVDYDEEKFREFRWWNFRNFSGNWEGTGDDMSKEVFAETFSDVDSLGDEWYDYIADPLDQAFYSWFYKGVASSGNCFGYTVESVYADNGRSRWNQPVSRFPIGGGVDGRLNLTASTDAARNLRRTMNVKMGYQLSRHMLLHFIGQFVAGNTSDPADVYEMVKEGLEKGHDPIISIYKGFFGNGHSVRPYRVVDEEDDRHGYVYIADPNVPFGVDPDDENIVMRTWIGADDVLGRSDDCWEFGPEITDQTTTPPTDRFVYLDESRTTSEPYEGCNHLGGGRLLYYDYGDVDEQPVTPSTAVLGAIAVMTGGLGLIIVADDAGVDQLSDSTGRTLFVDTPGRLPNSWDDLNEDPASQLADAAPIPLAMEGAPTPQMYGIRGANGRTLTLDTSLKPGRAAGTRYQVTATLPNLSAAFEIPGTPGVAERIVALSDTNERSISLSLPDESEQKEVTWSVEGPLKRWIKLDKLAMHPGQAITLKLEHAERRLVVNNEGPATTAILSMAADDGTAVEIGEVAIPSGEVSAEFTIPTVKLILPAVDGENGWYRSPVKVEMAGHDLSGGGIDHLEWSDDAVAWDEYAGPFMYAEEGESTLHYRAIGTDGAQSPELQETLRIDTRPPVIDPGVSGQVTRIETTTVNLNATDPVPGSGIANVVSSYNGQPIGAGESLDLFWAPLGSNDVDVTATDVAGWETSSTSQFELIATHDSLKETIRELRRRGEITSDFVEWSMVRSVKISARAAQRAQSGWLFSDFFTGAAKLRLHILLGKIDFQRGRHLSERAADILEGDVRYVLGQL